MIGGRTISGKVEVCLEDLCLEVAYSEEQTFFEESATHSNPSYFEVTNYDLTVEVIGATDENGESVVLSQEEIEGYKDEILTGIRNDNEEIES